MAATEVDVVVLGLGPGGEYAAQKLAEAGLRVVGVDKGLVGGECPFYGCIPSKMMIRAADSLAEARRAVTLGGEVDVTPDWRLVAERIDKQATNHWDDSSHVERLTDAGVEILRGTGRLDGPGRVLVAGTDGSAHELVATRGVILNAGTVPATLPIAGLEGTPYWTNREVVRLAELPESMVVIGAGPIGCELTQAFARFGVRVTLLEVGDRILGPEEPESSEVVHGVLTAEGVDVRAGVRIEGVAHDGGFRVTLADGEVVSADQLLVAAGRRTQLSGIGLASVGLADDLKVVETDERLRAGERLWAVGDITGKGQFTHVSMYQAAVVVRDILGEDGPWADYRAVSRVTFTDPEVGSVGMTERQAREAGLNVVVSVAQIPESSRGWIHQVGNEGIIKLVGDADRRVLVGASSVAPYGGEVLGLLAAAVHAEIPLATLRTMHFAYPTFHRAIEVALAGLDS
ncbi:NAD(P)/FAD-dependent oxidoreductase [Nocardioides sp. cx-169]|uniref:dihydrolipoyl dehydrogenase family protein n=1 Tax=Nocardioides sp. cx-169 TaxID=2899080 RepID=UPI001E4C0B08|nr:NAD(P)/FAD-dependent oxidoreductase [Nocardioides sp. cx-169]MCD4534995.1 NAD(P)/FAD-dependent oxidoreductase [Nocardioides sp. cx-169]